MPKSLPTLSRSSLPSISESDMSKPRKTVNVEKVKAYANSFLRAPGGDANSRYGVILMIEQVLFDAGQYVGFHYLTEYQVRKEDKPGIRTKVVEGIQTYYFDDIDPTRRE